MGRRKKIDMTGWTDSLPEFLSERPFCPNCADWIEMGYNAYEGEFKCPVCGTIADEDDFFEDDGDVPYGCVACGGPYPSCMTSCPIFDD